MKTIHVVEKGFSYISSGEGMPKRKKMAILGEQIHNH